MVPLRYYAQIFKTLHIDPEQFMGVDNYRGEFQPRIITVASGATVIWNNADRRVHTVVSGDGLFDKRLEYAESFSYTFTQRGSFNYYDKATDPPFSER